MRPCTVSQLLGMMMPTIPSCQLLWRIVLSQQKHYPTQEAVSLFVGTSIYELTHEHSITCVVRLTNTTKGDKLCDAIHTLGVSQRTYLELDSGQGPLLCVALAVLLKDSLQKVGGLIIPLSRVPLSGLNYLPTTLPLDNDIDN